MQAHQGVGSGESGGFQSGQQLPPPAQQVEIGGQRGKLVCVAQRRVHRQPPHPGPGVAHGGQSVQQLLLRGGSLHRLAQSVVQPLGDAPGVSKGLFCKGPALGPQQSKLAPPGGGKIRVGSGGIGFLVQRGHRLGHKGPDGLHAALGPERPQRAGAGKAGVTVQRLAVVGALPGQGIGRHLHAQFEDGLAVFDGEVVVGFVQQLRQPGTRGD